ncbi:MULTISPECIES: zinc ribbon domain-containing protein [unclassified Myxococcus]|uniref:zinc ribbon domain-containing protein n=1 Tax=unclassified Myxococcus TaxID=2648731 RepID=UPI00157B591C|nr:MULTISPECIES: zinc ribbon domain-containing protein [unclassified Myxococcus]NTX40790.1 zinc ribbon domain-containing protein [Myxococcus sp. CA033]NTX56207.1 zinc ribbon domain-containing protein [Myxococcus sp. CA039A]
MSEAARVAACERCACELEAEDLRCPICGLATPPPERAVATRERARVVRCESCGAAVEYSVEARAPRCAYCGAVTHVEMTVDPVDQAQGWLPFTVDPKAASEALGRFLGHKAFFRPSGLAKEASLESMRPLWWPAWVFQAGVAVSWTADSDAGARRSDWAPHAGRTRLDFTNILVPASRGLKVSECDTLTPRYRFELAENEGRGPEEASVERFEATRSGARKTVLAAVERLAREHVQESGDIPGSRFRNVHVAVALSSLRTTRWALPVYVLAYRYRGNPYRVLVHGQDAELVFGETPISKWRVLGVVVAFLAFMAALLFFTGGLS